ncbi:hypothetical protein BaRGS_00019347, partial [Batillaria attramentaria]
MVSAIGEVRGQTDCSAEVGNCFLTWQAQTNNGQAPPGDTCQASNTFLTCAIQALQSQAVPCDPFTDADIVNSLLGFVNAFSAPAGPCTFPQANHPALNLTPCKQALLVCRGILFQDVASPAQHCDALDNFISCTEQNLAACSSSVRSEASAYAANEDRRMDTFPTFCTGRMLIGSQLVPNGIVPMLAHSAYHVMRVLA